MHVLLEERFPGITFVDLRGRLLAVPCEPASRSVDRIVAESRAAGFRARKSDIGTAVATVIPAVGIGTAGMLLRDGLRALWSSVRLAQAHRDLGLLVVMPLVFATTHVIYGIGSLWGVIAPLSLKGPWAARARPFFLYPASSPAPPCVTLLTRIPRHPKVPSTNLKGHSRRRQSMRPVHFVAVDDHGAVSMQPFLSSLQFQTIELSAAG